MKFIHTLHKGAYRFTYLHEDVDGLPGVCLLDITGPRLPNLRITPTRVEPAEWCDLAEGLGRFAFENGPDDGARMAFPIFNSNEARQPDWATRRRSSSDRHRFGIGVTPDEDAADPAPSIFDRLPAMRTVTRCFGRYPVVYHPSLFPNEPTVHINFMLGPDLPWAAPSLEGVRWHVATPPRHHADAVRRLALWIRITRDDLL
jgi:hypothetical protein